MRVNLVDRLADVGLFLGTVSLEQERQPVAKERAVYGAVGQPERIEAGWLAARQALVAPAERAKEDFRTAILVEQDRARRELLCLGGKEVQNHRLARSRRADDREVAKVPLVEVEEVGRCAGRFENGDRLAPVIAGRTPHREAVKRDEAGGIGARNERPPDDILFVPRELSPEGRLKVDVLADGNRADVRQRRRCVRGRALQRLERAASDQQTQMMVAEGHLSGADGVAGGEHFGALGSGTLVGTFETPEREINPLASSLALDWGEALGDHQLMRNSKQRIEQSGAARVWIFLDAEDACEAPARR